MKFKHLQYLNLSHNKLGPLIKTLLGINFGLVNECLEVLFLVKCKLNDSNIKSLLKMFAYTPNLYEIDLSHNSIEKSYKELMTTLKNKCSMITNVALAQCLFNESTIDLTMVLSILKSEKEFEVMYLKRLDLSQSVEGDERI